MTDKIPQPGPQPDDWPLGEIEELAGLIAVRIAGWEEYGYRNPPAPHCAVIPPLGQRSADAITAGHGAVKTIDELIRRLHGMRGQLVAELRKDSDIRGARVDAWIAERRDGAK